MTKSDELFEVLEDVIRFADDDNRFSYDHHAEAVLTELARHTPNFEGLLDGTHVVVPKHCDNKMVNAFNKRIEKVEQALANGGMIYETAVHHGLDAAIKAAQEEG